MNVLADCNFYITREEIYHAYCVSCRRARLFHPCAYLCERARRQSFRLSDVLRRTYLGPLLSRLVVIFLILQELLRDAADERIVRVRIRQ